VNDATANRSSRFSYGASLLALLLATPLALLDYRYRGFQSPLPPLAGLLPMAGYAAAAAALLHLGRQERQLRWAAVAALALSLASVTLLFERSEVLKEQGDLTYMVNPYWPIALAALAVKLLYYVLLLGGLRRLALRRTRFSYATPVQLTRSVYATVLLGKLVGMTLYLSAPQIEYVYFIPLSAFEGLSVLLLLEMLWVAWRRRDLLFPRSEPGRGN
jgi:hypothetical protein